MKRDFSRFHTLTLVGYICTTRWLYAESVSFIPDKPFSLYSKDIGNTFKHSHRFLLSAKIFGLNTSPAKTCFKFKSSKARNQCGWARKLEIGFMNQKKWHFNTQKLAISGRRQLHQTIDQPIAVSSCSLQIFLVSSKVSFSLVSPHTKTFFPGFWLNRQEIHVPKPRRPFFF